MLVLVSAVTTVIFAVLLRFQSTIDLFPFIFRFEPLTFNILSFTQILTENFKIWFFVYGIAHIVLHFPFFTVFRVSPKPPSTPLLYLEFLRSCRSLVIGSVIEMAIEKLYIDDVFPVITPISYFDISPSSSTTSIFIACGLFPIVLLVGDAHFYWTHRLLHTKWLFAKVHHVHHLSFNPNPISGLSMHWVEASIYFSCAPIIGLFCPLWVTRLLTKVFLITPLQSHCGHTCTGHENVSSVAKRLLSKDEHYIHHVTSRYNYGSNPLWDKLMGTAYPADKVDDLLDSIKKKGSEKEDEPE